MTSTSFPNQENAMSAANGQWLSHAFGLTLRSDLQLLELPQLGPAEQKYFDVDIMRRSGIRPCPAQTEPWSFELGGSGSDTADQLHWRDVGSFRVDRSDRIEYDPNEGVSEDLLALPLLGTVMAVLLHHRGKMVLHGSAIELGGRAVVFVGDKGAGKSTTAASLVAGGRRILTDDVVALERRADGQLQLLPGYGQLKLTHEASDAIALPKTKCLAAAYDGYPKQRHVMTDPFDRTPVIVSDIFVLQRGDGMTITPLVGPEALVALMRFAYLTRFGSGLYRGEAARKFLDWCADVVRSVNVSRLEVPSSLSKLGSLDAFLTEQTSRAGGRGK